MVGPVCDQISHNYGEDDVCMYCNQHVCHVEGHKFNNEETCKVCGCYTIAKTFRIAFQDQELRQELADAVKDNNPLLEAMKNRKIKPSSS